MERTQIYLSAVEVALLDEQVRCTGASRSELIRRAVQAQYRSANLDARRAALARSAGSWKRPGLTGAAYTAALRGGLGDRLAEVGLR